MARTIFKTLEVGQTIPRELFQALAKDVPQENGNLVPNTFTHWNQINSSFPNMKIEVLGPPPSSGTRDAWVELVMEKGCKTYDWVKAMKKKDKKAYKGICHGVREDGAYIEAGENDTLIVQKLAANPDAYGFFGYSYYLANKDKIKAAAINGVKPSLEGIQDYSYPIARPLFFYAKKAHVGVVPGLKEFLDAFTSKKAMGSRGYLTDIGLVPLASDKYKVTRTAAKDLVTINLK